MSSQIQRHSPYQGLIPYSEADAPFFFGREKDTRLIIANLFSSPLTLLYGASGVGKTSVLRAGVAQQLRQRDGLLVVFFNAWQANPISSLMQAIADCADRTDHAAWNQATTLFSQEHASFAKFLTICAEQLNRRLMIILDQFEEYFLYHPPEDDFSIEFPTALTESQAAISFLISIREDSLAKLDRFEGRIPSLFDNYLRIEHLSYEAANDAIVKPIDRYNEMHAADGHPFSIEATLVYAVLKQVQTGQVLLGETGRGIVKSESGQGYVETPYLQLVMMRLWDQEMRVGSRLLKLETLKALGGAASIVRTHLDETMGALTPQTQDSAAKIFHYLVTPSGTKIAHTVPDLAHYAELPRTQLANVLEELASGETRILRGIAPPPYQPAEQRYEIFHDVLAAPILDWRSRRVQAQERAKAEQQLAHERARITAREAEAKRLRLLLGGLAVMFLVALGALVFALKKQNEAQTKADEATRAKVIAEEQRVRAEEQTRFAEEQKKIADQRLLDFETAKKAAEFAAAGQKAAELHLAQAKTAAINARFETLSTFTEAFGLNLQIDPGNEIEALEYNRRFLDVYSKMKDQRKVKETLVRMARLNRKLAIGNEISGNKEQAKNYLQEAELLEKRAEETQISLSNRRPKRPKW